MILVPNDAWQPSTQHDHGLILVVHNQELYIAKAIPEAIKWFCEIGHGQVEDMFGHIVQHCTQGQLLTCGFALSAIEKSEDTIAKYLAAVSQCQIQVHTKAIPCQCQIQVQGPPTAQDTVIGFW